MKSVLIRATRSMASLAIGILLPAGFVAPAIADWLPKNYVVAKDTISPDGRFGLVIPGRGVVDEDNPITINYFADVKAHRLLGKITKSDYFEHQNHRDLLVFWAPDSSRVLVNYEERYGFGQLIVLEPEGKDFAQAEIGQVVQDALDASATKQAKGERQDPDGEIFCRWTPEGKLHLRALGMTNPKQFENVKTYYAFFEGTYDPKTKKWSGTQSRAITGDLDDALGNLFRQSDFSSVTYSNEDDRAKALDEQLNSVYSALRSYLPADRFAQVKKEQIAWLKTRDAAPSTKAKCDLVETRIKALQELAW